MAQVQEGLLILCRIAAFIAISPVFSEKNFPQIAKVGLSGALTLMAWPAVTHFTGTQSYLIFALLVIKEVIFGLSMGYITKLIFSAVMLAGSVIDFQIGFSAAQLYDPSFESSMSQYGRVYYWLALCAFFITGLHRLLIKGILLSFQVVPLGGINYSGATINGVVQTFAASFAMGVSLAAPLVVALITIDITLGFVSRTVPQLNVLMMSLPVKQALGFLITLILLPNILSMLMRDIPNSIQTMWDFIRSVR